MNESHYQFGSTENFFFLKLVDRVTYNNCSGFKEFTDKILNEKLAKNIVFDLNDTEHMDSTILGIMAKYGIYCLENFGKKAIIFSSNDNITQILYGTGFSKIFDILEINDEVKLQMEDLPDKKISDVHQLKKILIDAHEQLVSLNEDNKLEFVEIINMLKSD